MTFDVVRVNTKGQELEREKAEASYLIENLGNGITLALVAIPGGAFLMGTEDEEIERLVKKFNWNGFKREGPKHRVTVPPFDLGKYPVTQAQWRAIADRNDLKVEKDLDPDPSHFKNPPLAPPSKGEESKALFFKGGLGEAPTRWDRPVEQVNWYDAIEFCARLSKLTGKEYRLPTEAEWEYACRAGTTTPFYYGETITGELANYRASHPYAGESKGEYRGETTPVGQFPSNAFGLYDMHGNVWEWCADTWHDNYDGAPTDGSAWLENGDDNRSLLRGGSWYCDPVNCRSTPRRVNDRGDDIKDLCFGFRVVCGAGRTL